MALNVWTKASGYDFGLYPGVGKVIAADEIVIGERYYILSLGNTDFTKLGASQNEIGTVFVATETGKIEDTGTVAQTILNERTTVNIPLPVNATSGITFKVISGSLPRGLRISGASILGTPFEVARRTTYKFVIRATNGIEISDRTFLITIDGADEPTWLTQSGPLPVGANNAYYIIDSSFIDFQLSAIDNDTAAGQDLNYFIASGEGELPPGLILLPNGRITGFIQPLLAVPQNGDQGFYDTGTFDSTGYDFGYRPTNGFDSFVYDGVTYDFNVETLKPRKLNRNYEFIATITDGDTVTKRRFRIYVVGDDFFRADNVIMQAGVGTYTADITYLRSPIFTTPKYLGLRRANNYQTFKIDIYEGEYNELGPVFYEFAAANAMVNALVQRDLSTDNRIGFTNLRIEKASGIPQVGHVINFSKDFEGASFKTYTITGVDVLGGDIYRLTLDSALENDIPNGTTFYSGTTSVLPPGMEFDFVTGEIFGVVPYIPAITETYTFTIKATRYGQGSETATSRRMFTVDILGEVESTMSWNTPSDLGTIDVGYPSSLFVNSSTTLTNSTILYKVDSGSLPPGLSLNLDGEIVGRVNQIRDQNKYRSFWKPATKYNAKDVIKQNTKFDARSVIRRKNIATVVTEEDHNFKTDDIIKVSTSELSFNYYNGIEIFLDKIKLNSATVTPVGTTGKYAVTFSTPAQQYAPLAFDYTLVSGLSPTISAFEYNYITQKSTSGNGTGAVFRIEKSAGSLNYNISTINLILLEPGTGYKPGDTIVISGASLGGTDATNDLSFQILTGTEFWYKVNGNSTKEYNGRFFALTSTTDSITLLYNYDPLAFGTGLISVVTSPGFYEAQTQLTPLNYFNYRNANASHPMTPVTGSVSGSPIFYRSVKEHVSSTVFESDIEKNWELYKFPEAETTLTTVDGANTTFDGETTNLDRKFTFTITAKDALGYSAITRTFVLKVTVPNNAYYSNITARPMMKPTIRQLFKNFINDSKVFDPKYIYRLGDSNFGIQRSLTSLIYAGVETKDAAEYVSAMGVNVKPKRFNIGAVKKAVAKVPGTNTVVYEVIYLELKDPLEKDGKHLPFRVAHRPSNQNVTIDNTNEFYNGPHNTDNPYWRRPNPFYGSIDRTDIIAGDPGTGVKFPSSISIWRKRIRAMPDTLRERNFMPLWMRSIQEGSVEELDFVMAIPLCYCKPGGADEILLNIKNSDFDFKVLDYTIDRFIIDSVEGYFTDKYLIFRNDRTTII